MFLYRHVTLLPRHPREQENQAQGVDIVLLAPARPEKTYSTA